MSDDTFTLDRFLSLPRVSSLALSPAGNRLVAAVGRPNADGTDYVAALWELDPDGARPPQRLTRSAPGESGPAFCPDGSILFLSARPDPDAPGDEAGDDVAALWLLPARAGEARLLVAPPGGVDAVAVAPATGTVALGAQTHPGTQGWDADRQREEARKEADVSALLFERYPIRHWDTYLGPRERRLYALRPTSSAMAGDAPAAQRYAPGPADDGERPEPVELTPRPERGLDQMDFAITPDGGTVVAGWARDRHDPQRLRVDLVALDTDSGTQRVLAADGATYGAPACCPDNRSVVCTRREPGSPDGPGKSTLWLAFLDGDGGRDLTPGLDLSPQAPVWAPDGSCVYFTADDHGHTLPFRVDLADGAVTRLATEGQYTHLCPSPDGDRLYALRSTIAAPPQAVVLKAPGKDQQPTHLPTPGDGVGVPGAVERLAVSAPDSATVESWLVLPPAAAERPAPLVVFIHGGPVSSWTGWHWRWNPHVLAQRGYAVLLPDPALSSGYGIDFIRRGWGRWGAEPYSDVLAAVDGAVARPDIDGDRVAAMGGSFGGYMANWIAGHTDRFGAIVTHASLWALEQFHGTTDLGVWWEREFGDPYADPSRYREHSPHRHVGAIRTPMLVIHGERDFRVPVGEALQLWTDLSRHGVDAKFLYFPDEHHWILKPQNARLWYQTVLAFLDHHLRGAQWTPPDLL